jgi:hypothetical protein
LHDARKLARDLLTRLATVPDLPPETTRTYTRLLEIEERIARDTETAYRKAATKNSLNIRLRHWPGNPSGRIRTFTLSPQAGLIRLTGRGAGQAASARGSFGVVPALRTRPISRASSWQVPTTVSLLMDGRADGRWDGSPMAPATDPSPGEPGFLDGVHGLRCARGDIWLGAEGPSSGINAVAFPPGVRDGVVPVSVSGSDTLGRSARVGNSGRLDWIGRFIAERPANPASVNRPPVGRLICRAAKLELAKERVRCPRFAQLGDKTAPGRPPSVQITLNRHDGPGLESEG